MNSERFDHQQPEDHNQIQERASFNLIRYANCWEDANILIKALNIKEGDQCLSIASAGDNSLALLTQNPALVVAVDLSDAQLACLELRMAAFSELSYPDLLSFLGFRSDTQSRTEIYHAIRSTLSPVSTSFWDSRLPIIEAGVIHAGKFERYLRFFGKYVLRLIHSHKRVDQLLQEKSLQDRTLFYNSTWNSLRWRLLFKVFFSRFLLGRAGRDPEFMRYVDGQVGEQIFNRVQDGLTITPTHENPYLRYILKGNFQEALPYYVREENVPLIKANLHKLRIFQGTTDQALDAYGTPFDAYNLSNIFEYMGEALFTHVAERLLRSASPGARLAYWNMLVPRSIPEQFPEQTNRLDHLSTVLFQQDQAFFYQSFHVNRVL